VGFITNEGAIFEVDNLSKIPEITFQVDDSQLLDPQNIAFFHTHPNDNCNLSIMDFLFFLRYPRLDFYIIGKDGIRKYWVTDGIIRQEDCGTLHGEVR
jgi:proteasome lid subunit RPN8/RPN11